MARSMGVGANLQSLGMSQKNDSFQMLGEVARQEEQRNETNKQLEQERKAGNKQLGSTLGGLAGGAIAGAKFGSAAGPWGTLIGGVVGAVAGGLFTVCLVCALAVSLVLPQPAEAKMTIGLTPENNITQMHVHQILKYDPVTGVFTWVDPAAQRVAVGDRAGYEKVKKGAKSGYRYIKIGSKAYAEHRLAWLYMTGVWPPEQIDHRNRTKNDNRFDNLRLATSKQNAENRDARAGSAAQFRGVSWSGGKWVATIMHFGDQKVLGSFDDIEDAKTARLKAEDELFSHGRKVT